MRYEQSGHVLTKLLLGFPNVRWTEEQEHEFLHELVINELDYDIALLAVARCKGTLDFAPSWHQFLEAYRFVWKDLQRAAEAKAALERPRDADDELRAANLRGFREFRRTVSSAFPTATIVPQGLGVSVDLDMARGARGHDHRKGAAGCKLCSKHDHSDTRAIGYTVKRVWQDTHEGRKMHEQKIDVPAYIATCPRCGDLEAARAMCDMVIAPLGITVLRGEPANVHGGPGDPGF